MALLAATEYIMIIVNVQRTSLLQQSIIDKFFFQIWLQRRQVEAGQDCSSKKKNLQRKLIELKFNIAIGYTINYKLNIQSGKLQVC